MKQLLIGSFIGVLGCIIALLAIGFRQVPPDHMIVDTDVIDNYEFVIGGYKGREAEYMKILGTSSQAAPQERYAVVMHEVDYNDCLTIVSYTVMGFDESQEELGSATVLPFGAAGMQASLISEAPTFELALDMAKLASGKDADSDNVVLLNGRVIPSLFDPSTCLTDSAVTTPVPNLLASDDEFPLGGEVAIHATDQGSDFPSFRATWWPDYSEDGSPGFIRMVQIYYDARTPEGPVPFISHTGETMNLRLKPSGEWWTIEYVGTPTE